MYEYMIHCGQCTYDTEDEVLQAHELTGEKLRLREIVMIDIANDPVKSSDYKPHEDPTKYKSQKTGRGPLVGIGWQNKVSSLLASLS